MVERWYVLDCNPEPWAIGPVGFARKSGKLSAYVGRNAQLDNYKKTVAEAIEDESPVMMTGEVDITFYFWRRQIAYTTPQARTHRKHEADATNMLKSTEDALQGILYKNDKDNKHVQAYVIAQGPDVQGKVVVCAKPYIGPDLDGFPKEVWEKLNGPTAVPEITDQEYGSGDTIF